MKFTALILCLGLLLIIGASCAPTTTVAPFRTAVATPTCQMDATTFVQQKVFFLSPNFNPQQTSNYQPPSGPSVYNVQPFSNDIIAAYNAAPAFFQQELCGLDGVFIVQNSCPTTCSVTDVVDFSWGFREHPPQIPPNQTPRRYIAISQQLWQRGQAPLLSVYETQRLRYLFHWPPSFAPPLQPPEFGNVVHDSSTLAVLAALAHEFGHVYWWDAFVPTPGGDVNPNNQTCYSTFYTGSWQNGPAIPYQRWVSFGDTSNNYHLTDDVNLSNLFHGLFNGNEYYTAVGDILHGIYSGQWNGQNADNGRWASALASFSTDEDFVETFQLNVLMNASPPLTNLPLTIYRSGKKPVIDDIPANLANKPVLKAKVGCVGPLPSLAQRR
jgi:hypothetical protein